MSRHEPRIDDGVVRDTTLRVPVGDEEVAATRYSPSDEDGPLPALLMHVPYPKDDLITFGGYDPLVRYLARNGYEVVVSNMLGTGGSSGRIEKMFVRREGREAAAIVEWLADRDWTTDSVGMFGKSYGGITALDAAAQDADALDAIVPIHTPYEGYRNAYTHGGAFELLNIGINWLTLMQALDVKPPSRRDDEAGWAAWRQRLDGVRDSDPWLFQFLDHGPSDPFWDDTVIPVEEIDVPMLAVGGWRDSYTRDTLEYFEAADAPKRLLLGPWRHTMPHRGRESSIDFRRQVVEWFDHFLKGEETGALDRPRIQYWTETDGGGEVDGGVWRGRDRWPRVGEGDDVRFDATANGLVDADTTGDSRVERTTEFDHTVGVASVPGGGAGSPPVDTTPDDRRSVCFDSDALEAPVELTGTGRATVDLDSSAAPHVLSVRLVDVAPDDTGRVVTHATGRTDHLETDDAGRTVVPLQPTSHVFEAGHRLRLAVSAAHFPVTRPASAHGSFTVRSRPGSRTSVSFPGRELASVAFADDVAASPPDGAVPTTSPFLTDSDGSWTVARERPGDGATVRLQQSAAATLPHAETFSRESSCRAAVDADDPASLRVSNRIELVVDYGDEAVRVVAENRIGPPVTSAETRVEVGDATVFEERWVR
ncbi:CocE/NonD family hydrolase [Halobacterium yunchengense]|uniref:CocE/NonD family hydrolase n=1 Tax=Halobacterium yunchengense TaxID=3108497 RepID=UPI0030094A68